MSLTNVWVQTQGDGLVRADQIVGIKAHQTPALAGKPARWLFDVVLTSSIGSGTREGWDVTVLHRTLIQTGEDPGDAPAALARLLSQLDLMSAAGTITTTTREPAGPPDTDRIDEQVVGAGRVAYASCPSPAPPPDITPAPNTSERPCSSRADDRGAGRPARNVPALVGCACATGADGPRYLRCGLGQAHPASLNHRVLVANPEFLSCATLLPPCPSRSPLSRDTALYRRPGAVSDRGRVAGSASARPGCAREWWRRIRHPRDIVHRGAVSGAGRPATCAAARSPATPAPAPELDQQALYRAETRNQARDLEIDPSTGQGMITRWPRATLPDIDPDAVLAGAALPPKKRRVRWSV